MAHYISDEDAGQSFSFGVERSQFGGLEVDVMLMSALTANIKHKKSQVWNIKKGGGSIMSSPVVHEDRIYFGSCDTNFFCITLSGKEVWHFGTDGVVATTPLLHDDVIYSIPHK